MPALDGTGPMGMGPMTGGGRGRCNPYFAGWRAPMAGYPFFSPFYSGAMPYGFGTRPWNPYAIGLRAFPYQPYGFRRAMRRRWW